MLILLSIPLIPNIWKESSVIKFGKDGIELQRIKDEVDKTIKDVVHSKSISPSALDDLFKSTELNEWLTLVLARMLMRQGLITLIPDHNFGDSPSLSKLIDFAFTKNLITQIEKDDLEMLREITFYAEWWGGRKPTHAQWQWALLNCKSIVKNLYLKQPII